MNYLLFNLLNFFGQSFKLTFWLTYTIYFLNQLTIDLAALLVCNISFPQTNVCILKSIPLSTELHMIQIVNLFTNNPFVKLWGIPLLSIFDNSMEKRSARYYQEFFLIQTSALSANKYDSFDSNDKDFLVNRRIISKSEKDISLNLTWFNA